MKRKDIDKIIATIGICTLVATPHLSVLAMTKQEEPLVCELIQEESEFKYDNKSIVENMLEEAERVKAEREEAERLEVERLRLEEEARIKVEEEARAIAEKNRRASVGVNLDNVLKPSNITAEELYSVFIKMKKPEMAELSWSLVAAEQESGVNCIFLAGLVANESAYGTSVKAKNQNNYTGYACYNSSTKGSSFASAYDCISTTAQWLRKEYLSPDGAYYSGGLTTYHINLKYCRTEDGSSVDFGWKNTINNISKTIEFYYHNM